MARRILRYEYRFNPDGPQLILWQALERGGKAVAASVKGPPGATPANLMASAKIQAVLPAQLKEIRI